jgi:ribonuclease HI
MINVYAMPKQKYYVVWKGVEPGIYHSWKECEKQVKGFEGAIYKSFPTLEMARMAWQDSPHSHLGKDNHKVEASPEEIRKAGLPVNDSISVDAACSGNPGKMEYRGVDNRLGIEIFRSKVYEEATVNIGEFLAIVHALAMLKKENKDTLIYSDSKTAMKWVRDKKARSKLEPGRRNKEVFEHVARAENWLRTNTYANEIRKWETKIWGEISADFGRK